MDPITITNGAVYFWRDCRLHNPNGPAVIMPNGDCQFWDYGVWQKTISHDGILTSPKLISHTDDFGIVRTYKDGNLHSYNGEPAIYVSSTNDKYWYIDGKLIHKQIGGVSYSYDQSVLTSIMVGAVEVSFDINETITTVDTYIENDIDIESELLFDGGQYISKFSNGKYSWFIQLDKISDHLLLNYSYAKAVLKKIIEKCEIKQRYNILQQIWELHPDTMDKFAKITDTKFHNHPLIARHDQLNYIEYKTRKVVSGDLDWADFMLLNPDDTMITAVLDNISKTKPLPIDTTVKALWQNPTYWKKLSQHQQMPFNDFIMLAKQDEKYDFDIDTFASLAARIVDFNIS